MVDAQGMAANWSVTERAVADKRGEPELTIGGPARTGEKAAQLSFERTVEWSYVSQTHWMILSPGDRYAFSAQLRADKPGRASIALYAMGEPRNAGEKVLAIQRREWIDLTSKWADYSVGAVVDNAGQYVRLRCVVQLHSPGVTMSIDDARLVLESANPAIDRSPHPTQSIAVACVRTDEPPVIDGKLDDACWSRAGLADGFTNLRSSAVRDPTQQTEVRLLHDDEHLFVAYRCYELELDSLRAEKTERDAPGLWNDDCVELFMQPPDSSFAGIETVAPKYFYLLVNSLGVQGDNVGFFKTDRWSGQWDARSGREKDAWTVELRVPLAELDSRPALGSAWRVNFTRSQKRLGENSTWAELDLTFHDPTRFANMYFVKDPSDAALVLAAAVEAQAGAITAKWLPALLGITEQIDRLLLNTPDDASGRRVSLSQARSRIMELVGRLNQATPKQIVADETALSEKVEQTLEEASVLANAADAGARAENGLPFILLDAPTITNNRILPTSLVAGRTVAKSLALSACTEEYESASFAVATSGDVEDLTIACSHLTAPEGVIDKTQIDVKLVKCWYQAFGEPWSGGVSFQRGKVLLPELLVNDDDLVRVDLENKRNMLRVADPKTDALRYEDATGENPNLTADLVMRDADMLMPVDIPAGQVRQFWVTVHVPATSAPGVYEGALTVGSAGSSGATLPIHLTVHPFSLAASVVEHSMYYRARLTGSDVPVLDLRGENKTETQYAAELRDMVAHGVTSPLVYQPPANMDLMRRALEIRQETGVRSDRFYFCAWGIGPNDTGDDSRRVLGEMRELVKRFGYREFYNYGPDEPSVEGARESVAAWRFTHDLGWKTYLACNALKDSTGGIRRELWKELRNEVDLFVVGEDLDAELAGTLRDAGCGIYSYSNPQCGIEEPETYRRNYGLALWKAGYSGAMNYAYQHGFGTSDLMWNDFDAATLTHPYRDHVMAYPTSNGVVGTLQWEGYREGVDDLRYLSTLLEAIQEAKRDPGRAQAAAKIEDWVDTIDPASDLDRIRDNIVARIILLTSPRPAQEGH
jgi:hypothetical protein